MIRAVTSLWPVAKVNLVQHLQTFLHLVISKNTLKEPIYKNSAQVLANCIVTCRRLVYFVNASFRMQLIGCCPLFGFT